MSYNLRMRAKVCMALLAVMIGAGAAAEALAEIKIFNGKSGIVTIINGSQPKAGAKPSPAPTPKPALQPPQAPIVRREGAVTITTEPGPSTMPSGGRQDSGQAACQTPKASVKVNYGKEEVTYDIDNSGAFRDMKKIVSDFSAARSVEFQETNAGECLEELAAIINVSPVIHLPAHLAVDGTGCKRLAQIEREQSFSAETAASYKSLASDFESSARQTLGEAKNKNPAEIVKSLKDKMDALLAGFDAAQEKRRESFKAADVPVAYFDDCSESKAKTNDQPL